MAVLCLLTNTPWPWPTPAGAASARGGVPHPERSGGRPQAGLHKRSAEDWGASCARQGRSPSAGLFSLALRGAHECIWGGRCGKERPAEEVVGRRQRDRRLEAGRRHPPSTWSICFRSYSFSNAVEEGDRAKMGRTHEGHITRARGAPICVLCGDFYNYGTSRKSWILM
jgi:hypothetical protein